MESEDVVKVREFETKMKEINSYGKILHIVRWFTTAVTRLPSCGTTSG